MTPQYISRFDRLTEIETDFLIVGTGSAGMRVAIEAQQHGTVLIVTKSHIKESNTRYAQGGIAVAMSEDDTIGFHIEDTLRSGVGLCDENAVRVMVEEGIDRVSELIDWGAEFDKHGDQLGFTLEAAHQKSRIVHRGDATGKETTRTLGRHLRTLPKIRLIEHCFVIDLITKNNTCYGVIALIDGEPHRINAKATIIASGGLGRIFECTSNPPIATGDGFAIAWRAGCEMIDMEFVQFHPTTLSLDSAPCFLISEAVRGEGGKLINVRGEHFMAKYDEREELAPRDVVSRACHTEMQLTNFPCVYLDITHRTREFIEKRFPTIYSTCQHYGLDISRDVIPVRSGAHFMMGGIRTNIDAETNIRGLYACGEVACTGVHGANRLASNSLLECLVFGARAGRSAAEYASKITDHKPPPIDPPQTKSITEPIESDLKSAKNSIQKLMWNFASIVRHAEDLEFVLDQLEKMDTKSVWQTIDQFEFQNMIDVSRLVVRSALSREESRGGHFRDDFPETDDLNWKKRIILRD